MTFVAVVALIAGALLVLSAIENQPLRSTIEHILQGQYRVNSTATTTAG